MLEQDYLMRIFLQFAEILRRSWFKARDEHDPKAAADMLENCRRRRRRTSTAPRCCRSRRIVRWPPSCRYRVTP
ncbi:MAG: hypothetical protein V8S24_16760 [Gordonibacter pamelaeae]